MLKNGIIRKSNSPWASRVILVQKKDGANRFVVDFRALNDCTKKDSYPLPDICDILDKLRNSRFYSTLDGASAYWSIPINENDIEKTAFITSRGKYEFLVMPFGLCNAPSSYQRLIDQVFKDVSCSLPYIRGFQPVGRDPLVGRERFFSGSRNVGLLQNFSDYITIINKFTLEYYIRVNGRQWLE